MAAGREYRQLLHTGNLHYAFTRAKRKSNFDNANEPSPAAGGKAVQGREGRRCPGWSVSKTGKNVCKAIGCEGTEVCSCAKTGNRVCKGGRQRRIRVCRGRRTGVYERAEGTLLN